MVAAWGCLTVESSATKVPQKCTCCHSSNTVGMTTQHRTKTYDTKHSTRKQKSKSSTHAHQYSLIHPHQVSPHLYIHNSASHIHSRIAYTQHHAPGGHLGILGAGSMTSHAGPGQHPAWLPQNLAECQVQAQTFAPRLRRVWQLQLHLLLGWHEGTAPCLRGEIRGVNYGVHQ